MSYNPNIHHRRSIRLKGYDYSQAGMYFVTICVQKWANAQVGANLCVRPHPCVRPHLFGKIVDGEMILNDAGKMVDKWCAELSNKFSDITLDAYMIMPNHFHAIIVNNGGGGNVGADLRVCPDETTTHGDILGDYAGKNTDILGEQMVQHGNMLGEHGDILGEHVDKHVDKHVDILGEHIGSPLRAVVQWFKTMTTNEYIRGVKTLGWQPFDKKLWQRNYWEHIIRNDNSYQRIANYIINNPANWNNDKLYVE